MKVWDFLKTVKTPAHRLAWLVAIAVDAIQIGALPLFVAGGLSPADAVLDAVAAFILIQLLGWHWAFLPTIAAELVPGFDLFPTWTAAVFFVTRQRVHSGEPEILPPGPAPARRRAGRNGPSFALSGLAHFLLSTHGLRHGLCSGAALRLEEARRRG